MVAAAGTAVEAVVGMGTVAAEVVVEALAGSSVMRCSPAPKGQPVRG